jgi:phenylpropionate dioxygenase-like ring-hydroxylating dioxygenase large terminal subunit
MKSDLDDPLMLREWFAVAWASEVAAGATLARRLLARDLVLWRESDGTLHCWLDLCIHRGAKLSLGVVSSGVSMVSGASNNKGDCLVCPYHGWRYAGSGECVAIPAQPGITPPKKARAESYLVQERYGVVFVSLGDANSESVGDMPEFALAGEAGFRLMLAGPYRFRALGPRLMENFLDVVHLGIVHAGLLGEPERGEIAEYEVGMGEHGPKADAIAVWQPNPDGTGAGAMVSYAYEVLGPLTAAFVKTHEGKRFGILMQVAPVDGEWSEARMVMAMDYGHEIPAEELIAFQDTVAMQDKAIVESQRPELLPVDLAAELHLKSDRMAIAYRKWLRGIGLQYGVA